MASEIAGIVTYDLSGDTVTAADVREGITGHDKNGLPYTGTLKTQVYRRGTDEPSNALGNDGDIYFKTGM